MHVFVHILKSDNDTRCLNYVKNWRKLRLGQLQSNNWIHTMLLKADKHNVDYVLPF